MAAARHLVVVGGADASATDALVDALRDEFAVRTAYSETDLLASLDEEVDVVLVDPALPEFDAARVREHLRERALDCQVGVLAGERAETATDAGARASLADAFVTVPADPATDEAWLAAVSRLAARARYRKRLEEYYDVADAYAALVVETGDGSGDDESAEGTDGESAGATDAETDDTSGGASAAADPRAERERLADHLDRLQAALSDAYDDLDTGSLFDVAIDPWEGDDPPWHESDDPDAGSDDPDAGSDDPDAGSDDPDAGSDDPDAGSDDPDAGSDDPDEGRSEGS